VTNRRAVVVTTKETYLYNRTEVVLKIGVDTNNNKQYKLA